MSIPFARIAFPCSLMVSMDASVGAATHAVDPVFARSLALGEQAVLDGIHAGLRPVRRPSLRVDVLDVAARRLRRNDQLPRNLLVRETAREQAKHLKLAPG